MGEHFPDFFSDVTGGLDPYPYQVRLGAGPWPEVVEVPTGLGKTAAIIVAWLWKRLHRDPGTPARLVYCLPMRVLVEQTARNADVWVARTAAAFEKAGLPRPSTHVLMGGEVDAEWIADPGRPAIVIGTQDMLLSRALMRGYGMSRYQWPIQFGLLHNDALWVFDEVQLMGPGLPTSAQLEAFRRVFPLERRSRSVWMSATLNPAWLGTVDLRPHLPALATFALDDADRSKAAHLLEAPKDLRQASAVLDREGARRGAQGYVRELARTVLEAHRPGSQTLVILNRVGRAQALFRRLMKERADDLVVLLLHARFRPGDRRVIEEALRERPAGGRIVVATQAVEAGVDVSCATLFTEVAPWSSMVQRFGRCNRYGEVEGGAVVYWIDIAPDAGEALPYDEEGMEEARARLGALGSASIRDLPDVRAAAPLHPVLRRRDFLELFDTEPDLSGFDIDISPYIRDQGPPQVQVFWRSVGPNGPDAKQPERGELCPVSMGQIRRYLEDSPGKLDRRYWTWDGLEDRWVRAPAKARPRPGAVLLLSAEAGGYAPDVGFDPGEAAPVTPMERTVAAPPPDAMHSDADSRVGRFVPLSEHTANVRRWVGGLGASLGLGEPHMRLLDRVALWHDVGKAHPAFQTALLDYGDPETPSGHREADVLWAKSPGGGRLEYRIERDGQTVRRSYFRHELASALSWIQNGDGDDLVAYLIAAHHGKVRMALRALPDESPPANGRRFARGVWEGDVLPSVELDDVTVPATELSLEVMELGLGAQGPSWTERTQRLLSDHGPFRLAWLEAVVRVADQQASAEERRESRDGGAR